MKSDNIRYAEKICGKYGVKFDANKLTGNEATIYAVAKAVLPREQLIQWLEDGKISDRKLRQELDMKPYDYHDAAIDAEIAKLQ